MEGWFLVKSRIDSEILAHFKKISCFQEALTYENKISVKNVLTWYLNEQIELLVISLGFDLPESINLIFQENCTILDQCPKTSQAIFIFEKGSYPIVEIIQIASMFNDEDEVKIKLYEESYLF